MSTYPNASLERTLDECFNTETVLFIESSRRNIVLFPNANDFQVTLPKNMVHCKQVVLTHFIMLAGNIPAPLIYIIVKEFQGQNVFTIGSGRCDNNFIVPGGTPFYTSEEQENDSCTFPRSNAPNVGALSISIVDTTGALVPITDYVIRLYVRSRY